MQHLTYRREDQVTASHHDDGTGTGRWVFQGHGYPTRKAMCEARRAEYVRLLAEEGVNFTQAAHAVGVSKRTGKAWRNGRARATGRNEKPSVDWYRSTMDKPRKIHARYLGQEERILIADRLKRPRPRKAGPGTRLWREILAGLGRHWSPEQIGNRLRHDFPDNEEASSSDRCNTWPTARRVR